jgi:hypothetical protein
VEKIREAHKKLIQVNHPDRGGSLFVATKVNEAKQVAEEDCMATGGRIAEKFPNYKEQEEEMKKDQEKRKQEKTESEEAKQGEKKEAEKTETAEEAQEKARLKSEIIEIWDKRLEKEEERFGEEYYNPWDSVPPIAREHKLRLQGSVENYDRAYPLTWYRDYKANLKDARYFEEWSALLEEWVEEDLLEEAQNKPVMQIAKMEFKLDELCKEDQSLTRGKNSTKKIVKLFAQKFELDNSIAEDKELLQEFEKIIKPMTEQDEWDKQKEEMHVKRAAQFKLLADVFTDYVERRLFWPKEDFLRKTRGSAIHEMEIRSRKDFIKYKKSLNWPKGAPEYRFSYGRPLTEEERAAEEPPNE